MWKCFIRKISNTARTSIKMNPHFIRPILKRNIFTPKPSKSARAWQPSSQVPCQNTSLLKEKLKKKKKRLENFKRKKCTSKVIYEKSLTAPCPTKKIFLIYCIYLAYKTFLFSFHMMLGKLFFFCYYSFFYHNAQVVTLMIVKVSSMD